MENQEVNKAFYVTFTFKQAGHITLLAADEEGAKNKLLDMFKDDTVSVFQITKIEDIPELVELRAAQEAHQKKVMEGVEKASSEEEAAAAVTPTIN